MQKIAAQASTKINYFQVIKEETNTAVLYGRSCELLQRQLDGDEV